MNLSDLASLAEIIGAVGVLATLIYLAIELRRNTAATRQQSYHDLVTRRSSWFDNLAVTPELTRIFISGQNAEDLDEVESQRYVAAMINYMSHFQDVYMQHHNGIVEAGVWEAERKILAAATSASGFKNWWREASQYFVTEFVEEVARIETVYPVIYDRNQQEWTRPRSELPWQTSAVESRHEGKDTPGKSGEPDS